MADILISGAIGFGSVFFFCWLKSLIKLYRIRAVLKKYFTVVEMNDCKWVCIDKFGMVYILSLKEAELIYRAGK